LAGGLNGGVKPAILEMLQVLQRSRNPGFDFCLITAAPTHDEIRAIATECDETICLDSISPRGALPAHFFRQRKIDILYAPFGMIRFWNCGIPIVSMVVDLLHRDYPHSLPEKERRWREQYFSRMVSYADRFQVISDCTGERLMHHYRVTRR
jgi:hypothetical protein